MNCNDQSQLRRSLSCNLNKYLLLTLFVSLLIIEQIPLSKAETGLPPPNPGAPEAETGAV